jgi:site-specific DNA-methyltransferase (cytosine-N4-specific)
MNRIRCYLKKYIQPFEKKLALLELETISGVSYQNVTNNTYEVITEVSIEYLKNKLIYWEILEINKLVLITDQSYRESTLNYVRNNIDINSIKDIFPLPARPNLPNRRCLRYGPHGIHEYRGKFFPQLVSSLINYANISNNGIILDPMMGSGTTLVESLIRKYQCIGIDINPLSVFISKNKCELLSLNPDELIIEYNKIHNFLLNNIEKNTSDLSYFNSLHPSSKKYLINWFSNEVLLSLDSIAKKISEISNVTIKCFMMISLSNILRRVSWQKVDDLRVRKDYKIDLELDPIREFLEELSRSVRILLAFLYQEKGSTINFLVFEGDAKDCDTILKSYINTIDLVITSPPYATALPYLDTDRLSLCYLNLLPRDQQRIKDYTMIGNREISEVLRLKYWDYYESNKSLLPSDIIDLIDSINYLNTDFKVGFRRKNLSSLLAKYFFDMREVLEGIYKLLKPGAFSFIIVGNNHTIAGGHRIEINTSNLLSKIAKMIGFNVKESINMEMLNSRDIFKQNSLGSEEILVLKK